MESTGTQQPTTQPKKQRLLYNRQRTYSDGDLESILTKDPKDMTEQEKIIWKVEILK